MEKLKHLHKNNCWEFRKTLLYAVIAALFGSYFYYYYAGGAISEYNLLVNGTAAEALVTNCADILDEDGENGLFTSRYCNYHFTVDGSVIESRSEDLPAAVTAGSTIQVLYSPANPTTNILKPPPPDARWYAVKTLKTTGLFIVCFFVGFWFIISGFRKYKQSLNA